jgi:dTDP-glucose 4,6-dehydratase
MRVDDGRVMPAFFSQAMQGKELTIFGDGSQTRSFCYVDDLVEGIYRLLMSDCVMPVNVGNPDEITIGEFAEEVIEMVGNGSISYHPLPVNDPKKRRPNIEKAKEVLGWEPKVSRAEGMRKTYEYFKTVVPNIEVV